MELVLPRLVAPAEVGGRLTFIDAARAREADAEAWLTLFMRLNERRNLIARELGGPLTLLLPPTLETDFARFAPDLRSIRSVAVEVDDLDDAVSGTVLLNAYDDGFGRVEDIQALAGEVERARTQAEGGVPAVLRMLRVLLLRLVGAKRRTGELDEAERLLDEAGEIDDSLGDPSGRTATQLVRSDLLIARGELDEAAGLIESAIVALREAGDAWALANAWGRLADILEARGELDEALRIRRDEQLPVYERLGDARSRALTMGKVADILRTRGELDKALRILRDELLPVFERLGDVRSRAVTMGRVAAILYARGELDEALRILRHELLPVYERLGDVRALLVTRANLALTLSKRQQQADCPEIHELLALALRDARRLQLRETQQIVQLIRQLGGDPDAPPFT
ncbi:tetratricopeptide repeat protein [Enhygromyxa salina]|uniref:tetratricopeptide repeat protein n=1 Tax=Enhygromyxa salina TaxID=215803 RepID=UPI0011BA65B0|nr:tetratricopeptide repeat protein [Enhygromyxa salina]